MKSAWDDINRELDDDERILSMFELDKGKLDAWITREPTEWTDEEIETVIDGEDEGMDGWEEGEATVMPGYDDGIESTYSCIRCGEENCGGECCDGPDPDIAYDQEREERLFGI